MSLSVYYAQGPPGKFLGLEEGSADFQVRLLLYTGYFNKEIS